MRIGVLGGTFDPPHQGHLRLAETALEALDLDEVLFMPTYRNPLKTTTKTPAKHRLEMVRRLVAGHSRMAVSDLEITRGGPSYTVDTLTELQMALPAEYWLIIGADTLKTLPNWKQPQRLLKMCRLAVALRPPYTASEVMASAPEEIKPWIDVLTMEPVHISATQLRDRLAAGQPVVPWLDNKVLQYIKDQKLYRG